MIANKITIKKENKLKDPTYEWVFKENRRNILCEIFLYWKRRIKICTIFFKNLICCRFSLEISNKLMKLK